jgi:hypothetical protein
MSFEIFEIFNTISDLRHDVIACDIMLKQNIPMHIFTKNNINLSENGGTFISYI